MRTSDSIASRTRMLGSKSTSLMPLPALKSTADEDQRSPTSRREPSRPATVASVGPTSRPTASINGGVVSDKPGGTVRRLSASQTRRGTDHQTEGNVPRLINLPSACSLRLAPGSAQDSAAVRQCTELLAELAGATQPLVAARRGLRRAPTRRRRLRQQGALKVAATNVPGSSQCRPVAPVVQSYGGDRNGCALCSRRRTPVHPHRPCIGMTGDSRCIWHGLCFGRFTSRQ